MPDDNQQEENNLEQLQQALEVATNNWKRAMADFENYKRRKEGENKELVDFAREVTVAKLLPALDSLEQALRHMPKYDPAVVAQFIGPDEPDKLVPYPHTGSGNYNSGDAFSKQYQNWQTGVNGIIIQLDKTLEELGVKKINALGQKFDPHFHEAVREEPQAEERDGIIAHELQVGYSLNGKIIRPSQVVVWRHDPKKPVPAKKWPNEG